MNTSSITATFTIIVAIVLALGMMSMQSGMGY